MSARHQLDQLRPDLQILRTGPDQFRLFDPRTGAHFELGGRERYLLSLIERCHDVDEIAAEFALKFGQSLPTREISEFLEQLRRQGLLVGSKAPRERNPDSIPHRSALPFQLRGETANVFFDVLTLLFGWMLHPCWLLLILPAGFLSAGLLIAHWREVIGDIQLACADVPLAPLFVASYIQTILLLNLPLALSVGMCCRKFRGRVRSFGMTWGNWVLPTVSFFTDISDSIAGMSPRGRRTQIAIGIFVPLALGALYTILWRAGSRANDGYLFWVFMVIPASVITLCQCNPFSVQTSAHWALAAAVDDWKLHSRALEETKAWLSLSTSPEPLTPRERRWLRLYGLAHYSLHFVADLLLLVGGTWLLTRTWGSAGAATMALLVLWWNRGYLAPLWRLTGMSFGEMFRWITPARSR